MTEGSTPNGSIWKFATSFLAGVVLTMIGAYFASQKDLVTRREFSEMETRYEQRFNGQHDQLDDISKTVNTTQVELGRLAEDIQLHMQPKSK